MPVARSVSGIRTASAAAWAASSGVSPAARAVTPRTAEAFAEPGASAGSHGEGARSGTPRVTGEQRRANLAEQWKETAGFLLRPVRVRGRDGRETAQWWGLAEPGKAHGQPAGFWAPAPERGGRASPADRILYSTTERPGTHSISPKPDRQIAAPGQRGRPASPYLVHGRAAPGSRWWSCLSPPPGAAPGSSASNAVALQRLVLPSQPSPPAGKRFSDKLEAIRVSRDNPEGARRPLMVRTTRPHTSVGVVSLAHVP
ncbi:RNaseH domain-containing protein [Streptomyces sp. NPDC014676]|uniref:RNaseH domain-containing protein n=1 Tax=Streptomyces sp. NPDC014676 TaxID=3364879 RepID=UPI0036F70622